MSSLRRCITVRGIRRNPARAVPAYAPGLYAVILQIDHRLTDSLKVASSSQAVAAAINGPEPGPEYILAELISGGNTLKSIAVGDR